MNNKDIIINFIKVSNINDYYVNELYEALGITKTRFILYSFKILNGLIFKIKTNYNEKNIMYIKKTIDLIYILCNEQDFNENEIITNRKRIDKSRNAIVALANKYRSSELYNCVNKLDSILLDKNINVEDFVIIIKKLIDNHEDVIIIKKFIKANKNIILLNRTDLFEYTFNLALNSLKNNTPDIYYYIALLKLFYHPNIDKDYFWNQLRKLNINNIYTYEIASLLNGKKNVLNLDEITSKYNYVTPKDNILLTPNKYRNNFDEIITIDSDTTKLRDDGLSIKKDGNKYVVSIHIADVGGNVKQNSQIDLQARNNLKCIYLIDGGRILPSSYEEKLSLSAGKQKDVITLNVVMNDSGDILDYYINKNNIVVSKNLSYLQSEGLINRKSKSKLSKSLHDLFMLANALENKDNKKKEYWNKKEYWKDNIIDRNEHIKSDIIIREFMILYNSLLGEFTNDKNIPYIYRCQEEEYISTLVDKLNIKLNDQTIKTISNITLNSEYSSKPKIHCGLGIDYYTQSCDPLRKYPDLYTQYLLHKFYFKDIDFDFDEEEFENTIDYFNRRSNELKLMRSEYISKIRKLY